MARQSTADLGRRQRPSARGPPVLTWCVMSGTMRVPVNVETLAPGRWEPRMPISFDPSDEHKLMRDEVGRFALEKIRPKARECETAGALDEGLRSEIVGLGIPVLDYPEQVGGAGMDFIARAIVEEELAFGDAGVAFATDHPGPAGYAILELGSDAQRERWLKPFAGDARRKAALAWQEDDLGAELGALTTRAERDGSGYVIQGAKRFVPFSREADLFVVLARMGDAEGLAGVRAFVVPAGTEGIWGQPPGYRLGLRTVPSGDIGLLGVRVPGDHILDGPGDADGHVRGLERLFARMRVVTAARQVGVARAACEHSSNYAQTREAFGQKIGQFQAISFMIAQDATVTNAARWMAWRAARAFDKGDPAELVRLSSLALITANRAAVRTTIDSVQVMGGMGFMEDDLPEKWMRDARTLANVLGADEVQRAVAGRGVEALA